MLQEGVFWNTSKISAKWNWNALMMKLLEKLSIAQAIIFLEVYSEK